MKTPIAYYGGKQQLASRIIGLIPEHKIYVEPFFGGGAVFWAKKPSDVEIINDTNGELINFYRVLRQNADLLIKEIDATLNSRETYRHAEVVLRNADMFDEVKRAWAVWVISNMAYCHKWFAGWGYQLSVRQAIANARDRIGGGGVRLRRITTKSGSGLFRSNVAMPFRSSQGQTDPRPFSTWIHHIRERIRGITMGTHKRISSICSMCLMG